MMADKFDEVRAIVNAFLKMYPDASWGFAHTVLEDDNFDSHFISSAIQEGLQAEPSEWRDPTIAFLQFLMSIPEELRLDSERDQRP